MGNVTIVYLLRHGDVENPGGLTYGRERNVHLSEKGKAQILALAGVIKERGDKPDTIITSPLNRTIETSLILSGIFDVQELHRDTDMLETDSKGFVGLSIEYVRNTLGDIYSTDQKEFEIETPESITERMKRAFFRAVESRRGNTILFVSHGDPLAFLTDALLHPGKPLRPITQLRHDVFLQTGAAWRLKVESGNVLSGWEKLSG